MCAAVIYVTLRTAVIAGIIFIVVVLIAVRLLALCHRYAATCKLHRAPLQDKWEESRQRQLQKFKCNLPKA